ncbi:serine protease [Streptomyces sp. LS1784]|uniref:trypsin-like serine peptidase n=1 Tax=Streptomyces sp. LS1784 TaxID=2851533 RepID=UPI001CCC4750|nr:hypothetical protein [Streptomyces sp. LS1784]
MRLRNPQNSYDSQAPHAARTPRSSLGRTVLAATAVLALTGSIAAPASAAPAATGRADAAIVGQGDPSPYTGVERLAGDATDDPAADQAAQDSWTPEEMRAAIPMDRKIADQPQPAGDATPNGSADAEAASGPIDQASAGPAEAAAPQTQDGVVSPRGSWPSSGVPTVGAIFFKIGLTNWRCTGTVINTASKNIIATAGHCIFKYVPMPSGVFVPGYRDGQSPYGKWSVKSRWIDTTWKKNRNPDYDYGFLVLKDQRGRRVQDVTGGNGWRTNAPYFNYVEITGYPGNRNTPLQCITSTRQLKKYAWHVEFPCDGFANGVSGSLLMENFNNGSQLGTAIASLGGVDDGGKSDNVSSAVLWNSRTAALLNAAVRGQ